MFNNTHLQEFLIKYNITEDRKIKTITLSRIYDLQDLVELTVNQTIDCLICLFQNNDLNWSNNVILVELRGAFLQGQILQQALQYIPELSKKTIMLNIQGNKNTYNLTNFMKQFLLGNNQSYFTDNQLKDLITKKAVIFSEVVNSGITVSNEAQSLKEIGFEEVEVWTIAKTNRGNLPNTKLDDIDKFFWGKVIPPEDTINSYCILTSTDAWSSGILRLSSDKKTIMTQLDPTPESQWAKGIISKIINKRIKEVVDSLM